MSHQIAICTLLLTLVGCAAPAPRGEVIPSPAGFPGYPSPAHLGAIWTEAAFATNHVRLFGEDLTDEGILPIHVKVGLQGAEAGAPRLAGEALDPHLYLQDGTVLEWVPHEEVVTGTRAGRARVTELALPLSLLEPWSQAPGGFVFFRIGDSLRLKGTHALSSTGRCHRELDLLHSLLELDVAAEDGSKRLFVGLTSRFVVDSGGGTGQ